MTWTIPRIVVLVVFLRATWHILVYGIVGNIAHRRRKSH